MSALQWNSYSDFYKASPYALFPQEHRQARGLHSYRMIAVDQGPHNFSDPEVSETIVALPLEVDQDCTWRWEMSGHRNEEQAVPGRMVLVPSGVKSDWEVDKSRRILMLTVPDTTVHAVLGGACPQRVGDAFAELSRTSWADEFVATLLKRMWDCADGSQFGDRYLADGLIISLLSQLMIITRTVPPQTHVMALPLWRLRRVRDFVDAHLDQDVTMADLAQAAGFSTRHFARSFRMETGETPHRWVMKRRLDKAKTLLVETDDPLADIATRCGFSSQSHLTTLLKQVTGLTPRHWRHLQRN